MVAVVPAAAIPTMPPGVALHVPPASGSVRTMDEPSQTTDGPVMGPGTGLTIKGIDAKQPVAITYEMFVEPADTPVTIPEVPTVAIAVLPLTHVPPGVASVSVTVEPTHTNAVPPIEAGVAFTVIVFIVRQPGVPAITS